MLNYCGVVRPDLSALLFGRIVAEVHVVRRAVYDGGVSSNDISECRPPNITVEVAQNAINIYRNHGATETTAPRRPLGEMALEPLVLPLDSLVCHRLRR